MITFKLSFMMFVNSLMHASKKAAGSVHDQGYPSMHIDIKKTKKSKQRKSREKKAVETRKNKKKRVAWAARPSAIHLSWLFHSIDACPYSSKCSIMDNQ